MKVNESMDDDGWPLFKTRDLEIELTLSQQYILYSYKVLCRVVTKGEDDHSPIHSVSCSFPRRRRRP